MAGRKYYALCDSNCKFETMTKEQILTAIAQAVKDGTVGDIDTGFITTIKTINGTSLKFFVGTQAEYESLTDSEKNGLFAIITNDTNKEALFAEVERLSADLDEFKQGVVGGEIVVAKATNATKADIASVLAVNELTLEENREIKNNGYYYAEARHKTDSSLRLCSGLFYFDGTSPLFPIVRTVNDVQYQFSINYNVTYKKHELNVMKNTSEDWKYNSSEWDFYITKFAFLEN